MPHLESWMTNLPPAETINHPNHAPTTTTPLSLHLYSVLDPSLARQHVHRRVSPSRPSRKLLHPKPNRAVRLSPHHLRPTDLSSQRPWPSTAIEAASHGAIAFCQLYYETYDEPSRRSTVSSYSR